MLKELSLMTWWWHLQILFWLILGDFIQVMGKRRAKLGSLSIETHFVPNFLSPVNSLGISLNRICRAFHQTPGVKPITNYNQTHILFLPKYCMARSGVPKSTVWCSDSSPPPLKYFRKGQKGKMRQPSSTGAFGSTFGSLLIISFAFADIVSLCKGEDKRMWKSGTQGGGGVRVGGRMRSRDTFIEFVGLYKSLQSYLKKKCVTLVLIMCAWIKKLVSRKESQKVCYG